MPTSPHIPLPGLDPIDRSWRSWDGVHGGYALARVAAAAIAGAEVGSPRAINAAFLAATPAGKPLNVALHRSTASRSAATVRADVVLEDRVFLEVSVRCEVPRPGNDYARLPAPQVDGADNYSEYSLPADLVPFGQHLEVRPVAGVPLSGGHEPDLLAWVRLREVDLTGWQTVTVLLDALPPALYAVATQPAPIPTVTLAALLTEHAAMLDPASYCLVRIRTDLISGNWAVETSWVWDEKGLLLGYATQQRKLLGSLGQAELGGPLAASLLLRSTS